MLISPVLCGAILVRPQIAFAFYNICDILYRMTYFQSLIRDLNKVCGLTQTDIAKLTESSQSQIGDFLNGKRNEPLYSLGHRIVQLHARLMRGRNQSGPEC